MNKVILDSSAFLALLNNEEGKDIVEPLLPYSIMSCVNIPDIVSILHHTLSIPLTQIHKVLSLIYEIYPFDKELAIQAGLLHSSSNLTLSLGDRVSLALASYLNLPIYTANKSWSELDTNITITLIR